MFASKILGFMDAALSLLPKCAGRNLFFVVGFVRAHAAMAHRWRSDRLGCRGLSSVNRPAVNRPAVNRQSGQPFQGPSVSESWDRSRISCGSVGKCCSCLEKALRRRMIEIDVCTSLIVLTFDG